MASTCGPLVPATHQPPTLFMAVDQYAPCPCGSGKKLKFCCSDLVHEIEKVHRMLEGDQPRAALSHLEATLTKAPGRASLLDLKASIELSLGDDSAARTTIDEYCRVDPQNPSAHAQAALLAAAGDAQGSDVPLGPDSPARQAVGHLQDALELVTDSIPARVLQAIGATGQALLTAGALMAARAHLWLYQGVAGDEDTRAMELLMRLNQVGGLPLLLRDTQFLREAPLGHPVEAQHDYAQLLASRGQWRRAAELLDQLCQEHADLSILHHNAAIVHGWLGDQQRLVAGLRKYAELTSASEGLIDDAIEAEAIAQLLDEETRESAIEVVRTTYKVTDEEALIDRLTRDKRVSVHRLSEADLQALDGPPPRHTMLVLDKPLPETGEGITADTAPRIAGVLSYFGRTTSRDERLEFVADRDEEHANILAILADIMGDSLGESEDEVIGQSAAGEIGLRSRWRFPDDTPVAERRAIMTDERRRVLTEEWPAKPLAKLADKTPVEAADDESLKLPLTAAMLVLEQTVGGGADPEVFQTLRQRLGVQPAATIDPKQADLETLPMARVARVDLKAASDDDLFTLYKRTEIAGATEAALLIAREAIHRPGLNTDLPAAELYSRLAALEPEISDALGWIEQARNDPGACGDSCATWDLAELELRVMEGQFDEANGLVHHLRDEHLNEPGVAERLYQLLSALGAVPSADQAAAMPGGEPAMPAEQAPPAGGGSAFWTPGSDEPAAGGGGKKIWTPG